MNRFKRTAAVMLAAALILSLTACGDRKPPGSSSSSTLQTTSAPQTSTPETSSQPETSLPSSSSGSEPATPTMSADFAALAALDSKPQGWGPGGPVDDRNRSVGSLQFNKKYGKYNAAFINEESDHIYLTFDQGYENGYTPPILDTLKEKEIRAIFFLTYDYAKRNAELVQRMIDEGHVIANHSWSHASMPNLPLEKAFEDTKNMHDYIVEHFGYTMNLYRFPSGEFNEQTLALMQSLGYKSVFWSFAYRDWEVDNQPDPAASLKKIVDSAHPGGIYLLHSVSKTNAEILDDVIDQMRARGFVFGDPSDI